jgi:hypothetical protein
MTDALEQVLKLVAEGRLTAEEAAPILDALERLGPAPDRRDAAEERAPASQTAAPRFARIEVIDDGRTEVNLRVPLSLGRAALASIPGLSTDQLAQITNAMSNGLRGPILEVGDAADGVRISIE